MNRYIKKLLNLMLDKYERSSLYRGSNTVNVRITLKFSPDTLPEYYNEYNYEQKQEINEQCRYLESLGFITIGWKRFEEGNIIDKVVLNLDHLEEVYQTVGREGKQSQEEKTAALLETYVDRMGWFGEFLSDMLQSLRDKKSVKRYLDIEDSKMTGCILKVLDEILKQEYEIPKRVFSIRLFNDSKLVESIESKVARIIKDYAGLDEEIDVLAEYNVVSNPGFVYLKGVGEFQCGEQNVNLSQLGGEIGLSTSLIQKFDVKILEVNRVLTIENLTSFHYYCPKKELVIYLGGYHNSIRRSLLQRIYSFMPTVPFYHWGDIDVGGFRIFNHLRKNTGIPFMPLYMDIVIMERYRIYCKNIDSKSYLESLQGLRLNPEYKIFYRTIDYMLEKKLKLEQEAMQVYQHNGE